MTDERDPVRSANTAAAGQLVYVVPSESIPASRNDELELLELWRVLWKGKWLIIAIVALFSSISVAYALLATKWYRADVLLVPTEQDRAQSLAAQVGGLASLAGLTVGGGGDTAEAIAVLKSREFARNFIKDFKLMPVLFADQWDSANGNWKAKNPAKWPDIRDAVKFFDEKVRGVTEDRNTGLVTLSIEWTDAATAARWANVLVDRLNERMRQRALMEAEVNIAYLRKELTNTNLVTLQQSIGRLLETELQKEMLARGNKEFTFRVVDPAVPPRKPARPRRRVIAVAGTVLGGVVGVLVVLVGNLLGRRPRE